MLSVLDDVRFRVPLYTQAEAARYLDMPPTTFRSWARGYTNTPAGRPAVHGGPLITHVGVAHPHAASIPFIGLAEGMFLSALRSANVPMQEIRPALDLVRERLGLRYALASRRLYVSGAKLLWEIAEEDELARDERRKLVVLRDGQYVFREVVEQHMKNISYDADDQYAARIELPGYEVAVIAAEPGVNFGRPYFTATGTPLFVVAGRLRAGESVGEVADDFGIPEDHVAEVAERVEREVA